MKEAKLEERRKVLKERMSELGKHDLCLAFSGGVDSSLLLKLAVDAAYENRTRVWAVTFQTRLHPACDLEIAKRVAEELGANHVVLEIDELSQEMIRNNPPDRCYLCKHYLFETLKQFAKKKGADTVLDGTNEDDLHVYRPGIRALKELGIVSPLAELHITKEEVKALAAGYGISVASRPSTPCMATRLPYHTPIHYEVLERIEKGEEELRKQYGGNIRLRLHGDVVRLEVDKAAMPTLAADQASVVKILKRLGFHYITMDLEGFRSGSMDEVLNEIK